MEKQTVLVIGSGGREHAITWALAKSPWVKDLFAMPGNPGTGEHAIGLKPMRDEDVVKWAKAHRALVVIGPEDPLARGLADALRAEGVPVFGPGRDGARLESSKRFAKEMMAARSIPTAGAEVLKTPEIWRHRIETQDTWPMVVKQNGLAQGKGVVLLHSRAEALDLWQRWKDHPDWFEEGLLWEDYLIGREISVEVLTNGREYVWLPPAVDHKRLTADAKSPNTGGMGAYAPVPWLSAGLAARIDENILAPTMAYMAEEPLVQSEYFGVLYAGLMVCAQGPFVLEFNVRFGDPEAQSVIPLIDDDLFLWIRDLSEGRLHRGSMPLKSEVAVGVVLASEGYPAAPLTERPITFNRYHPDALIFHAGTAVSDHGLVSRGGRVLTVVGLGQDFETARQAAYAQMGDITLAGGQYRSDIAAKDSLI